MHRPEIRAEQYGTLEGQVGDLYLPRGSRSPVVCLLHGGFWRLPYGRDQYDAVARDLAGRGFAVWNLEYRRLGAAGGGWPGTFDDVVSGIDHLAVLAARGVDFDLRQVIVVGHSAGGHLAFWSAARQRADRANGTAGRVRITAVAGMAPVADLVSAHAQGVGGTAVSELLGAPAAERPRRLSMASPSLMLPLAVPQLIVHGTVDDVVPIAMSRAYERAARASGDEIELLEIPDAGHMDMLEPSGAAHALLCRWLSRAVAAS
jgi:acetyl esterase/lipase